MTTTKIFVGIPAVSGLIKVQFLSSILALYKSHLAEILNVTAPAYGSQIATIRNNLSHAFLQTECTHILFVDSDMEFGPGSIERMVAANRDFVGCVCVQKFLDTKKFYNLAKTEPYDAAMARSSTSNIMTFGPEIDVVDGLIEIKAIGFGLCLIKRSVFDAISESNLVRKPPVGPIGFFDPIATNSTLIGEDFSLCERWRNCGGKVWGLVGEKIGHVGDFSYSADISSLRTV